MEKNTTFYDAYFGVKKKKKKERRNAQFRREEEMFHKNVLWALGDPTFYDMDRKKRKSFHRLQIERETTEVIKRRQGFFSLSFFFSLGKNYVVKTWWTLWTLEY